jgi:hypothetical protein
MKVRCAVALQVSAIAGYADQMYDLRALGWSSFQQLCLTITREILGQTVESFLDSADGGWDGAFTGTWRAPNRFQILRIFVSALIGSRAAQLLNEAIGISPHKFNWARTYAKTRLSPSDYRRFADGVNASLTAAL